MGFNSAFKGLLSCFPGMLLGYCLSGFEIVAVSLLPLTSIMRLICIMSFLCCKIVLPSFSIAFLRYFIIIIIIIIIIVITVVLRNNSESRRLQSFLPPYTSQEIHGTS